MANGVPPARATGNQIVLLPELIFVLEIGFYRCHRRRGLGSRRAGQRRLSIKITSTMITMRTTVPMPIYMRFPPSGRRMPVQAPSPRLPAQTRVNQESARVHRRRPVRLGIGFEIARPGISGQADEGPVDVAGTGPCR